MRRVNIPDSGGQWFNADRAEVWASQDGEALYRTIGARWVLYDGTYRYVTDSEAQVWLLANGLHAEAQRFAAPVRGGRPEIGGAVRVRLGGLLPAVDQLRRQRGESRAETVRHLVWRGIQAETGNQHDNP